MRNRKAVFAFVLILSVGYLVLPSFTRAAQQAALFLNPQTGTLLVGSTFDVSIVLDTKGQAVNTVEVELMFPADKMQVANPSVGRSIVQLWPSAPSFSNRQGRIYFIGGIPSPGIVISQGVVLTITFRAIAPGSATLKFGKRTSVLANDGRGTNILGQRPSAFYKFILPPPLGPEITSPTHPDQDRWYRDTNPVFVWEKSQFADGYSYVLDRNPSGFPDTTSEGAISTASFESLENGIWYFHLRERAGGVWGGVSHYALKIDSAPPAAFRVHVSPGKRTTNRNPIFRFFTTDALSGFDHFEMKVVSLSQRRADQVFFFEVASPYQAPNFKSGRYQVIVRALDRAGNPQDEAVTLNIVGAFYQFITPEGIDFILFFIPWGGILIFLLLIVAIFGTIVYILWRRHKQHLRHAFREDLEKLFNFWKFVKEHHIFKDIFKSTGR
ncbi:hypothetical protein IIA95_03675 [Patescibacteria group bacterium]|nr:hypothetical protein [Patescibacteria group bacterium]